MVQCPKCKFLWTSKNRSSAQNDLYWGNIVTPFAEHLGYTQDECHEYLKENCNSEIVFRQDRENVWHEIRRIKSTAELDTSEFSEYINKCLIFASKWGCYLTMPGDSNDI